jgi:uncharacterized protein (DUF3820 family)
VSIDPVVVGPSIGTFAMGSLKEKNMKMPYGKYKGQELEDIPTDYIIYVLEEHTLTTTLEKELQNQLDLREGKGVVRNVRSEL